MAKKAATKKLNKPIGPKPVSGGMLAGPVGSVVGSKVAKKGKPLGEGEALPKGYKACPACTAVIAARSGTCPVCKKEIKPKNAKAKKAKATKAPKNAKSYGSDASIPNGHMSFTVEHIRQARSFAKAVGGTANAAELLLALTGDELGNG